MSHFLAEPVNMKLLHVTCTVSPHQMPLARNLAERLGVENYRFAATLPAPQERIKMGWDLGDRAPWMLRVSETDRTRQEYEKWWREADVVLCGDTGSREKGVGLMEERLKRGKLTYYMSERWWKPPLGMMRLAHPGFAWTAVRFRRLAGCREFHYLPVGLHAAVDMKLWAAFEGRTWLWGYFTALPADEPKTAARKNGLEILYAGRLLGWKQVHVLIRAFGVLWPRDKTVRLTIIGDGPKRQSLKKLTRKLGLSESVNFQPSLPMERVWQRMRAAHIYVLPSNGYEGWGAVVNEAMTQGCVVVASEASGAARTMIQHGANGLLFKSGDWRGLGDLLCRTNADEPMRKQLAQAGQRTILNLWSPKVAAERLLNVTNMLLAHESVPAYADGPMFQL
jgi:glycosyltransferase involved in cell wall biosynthesis